MLYGFYKWKKGVQKNTNTDNFMFVISIVVICIYFFTSNGNIIEALSSGSFLIGGLFLARNRKIGWYINLLADTLLVFILLESNDYLFICFQILSIWIALKQIYKNKNSNFKAGVFIHSNKFLVFHPEDFLDIFRRHRWIRSRLSDPILLHVHQAQ